MDRVDSFLLLLIAAVVVLLCEPPKQDMVVWFPPGESFLFEGCTFLDTGTAIRIGD